MATKNLTLYSDWRVGTGSWFTSWTPPLTSSNNNGDNNRFYLGGSNKYRTKFKITIDTNLVISSTKKLVLKITGDESVTPKYMRAYLSTTNYSSSTSDATIIADSVEMSYMWLDIAKTERATSYQKTPVPMYAIFNYQLKPGSSYFIYLLPFASDTDNSPTFSGTWLRAQNKAADCSVNLDYESYSAVGLVTNQKINTNSIYKDGQIVLSWGAAIDGVNNKVSKYRVYYQVGSYPTATTKTFFETTSTSIVIKNSQMGNLSKGTTIYFSIQTIGTISGFDSTLAQVSYCEIINKPPTWPSFSILGVISSQQEATKVTVTDILATDIDGDTLTYYYKISDQPSSPSVEGAQLITSGDQISVSPDNRYVYIWAYDGVTYGSPARKTVEINSPIEITSITISGENIQNNMGLSCTRTLNASAALNKTAAAYKWFIWNEGALEYSLLGTTASLSNVLISGYAFSPGERIIIKLQVTDEVGDSASQVYKTNLYQMADIKVPSAFSIVRNENTKGTVASKYMNTKLSASVLIPEAEDTDIPLKSLSIKAIANNVEYTVYTGLPATGVVNNIAFEYDFLYNKNYVFFAEITDNANRTISTNVSSSFERLPRISLASNAGISNSVSPNEWHVLKNQEFAFSTLYPDDNIIGQTTYELYANINNGVYKLLDTFTSDSPLVSITGSTITYRNSNSFELFKKLRVSTNSSAYKVNYRIVALNAFGVVPPESYYGAITNKTIITRESPYFEENAVFSVRVGFTKDRAMSEVSYNEIPTINTIESNRMFNAGEVLDFCLSKMAIDLNNRYFNGSNEEEVQSISSYKIEYVTSETVQETPSTLTGWRTLGTLSPEIWIYNKELTFFHQGIIVPNLGNTKTLIYFRICAVDNTKLTSNYLYFNQPLIYCRRANPYGTISKITLIETDTTPLVNVILDIEDYGGNDLGYENFFRKGTEETTIEIKYGPSATSLDRKFIKTTKTDAVTENFTFNLDYISSGKIYFQFSIIINTNEIGGEYNQIIYTLPIYVFYSEGPTVSHRPHWIGLNNTVFANDEVMRIEAFKKGAIDRHILRFIGFDSQNNVETAIELDLNRRTIAGVVINGGNWDGIPEEAGYVVLEGEDGTILYALEE